MRVIAHGEPLAWTAYAIGDKKRTDTHHRERVLAHPGEKARELRGRLPLTVMAPAAPAGTARHNR